MISKIFRRRKEKKKKRKEMRKKAEDATRLKMVIGVIHTLMAFC